MSVESGSLPRKAGAHPANLGDIVRIFLTTLIVVIAAELLGPINVPIGPGNLTLLPLIWALLLGAALSLASPKLPAIVGLPKTGQVSAAKLMQPALLLFISKLGLMVGGSIPKVLQAGWSLAFQEFGHFLGTMIFGLPVALLLGIKREAVGATFSVGREPSLAIIGERFGMNSPEGRGVLAEYLTGTIFGAIFIALFAGWIASTGWLSPYALAMGAGIGSGSMMAAASGAITAHQPASVAADLATFAAASNLITTTIGTYFTLLISLPFTIWAYGVLEPILGRKGREVESSIRDEDVEHDDGAAISLPLTVFCWFAVGAISLIGNQIGHGTPISGTTIAGMLIIVAISAVGYLLYRITGARIPAVLWCSVIAMLLTAPWFSLAPTIDALTKSINFLSLVPPILTFAGLSIAKDIPAFRRLGWRIVLVSLCANAGTFLGASLIAQFLMHKPV